MIGQTPLVSTSAQPLTLSAEKASLIRRFLAYGIDIVVLSFVSGFATRLLGNYPIIPLAIYTIYFVGFYSTSGQTLGKRILSIQVVTVDDSYLNWRKGMLRTVGYVLSMLPFGLGFLWAIFDADKQAGQDKIAGTYVVRASAIPQPYQAPMSQPVVRRRQRRWLLLLGIPSLVIVASIGYLIWLGVAEVRAMGPWPGPEVSPNEVVSIDLSQLALSVGQSLNARQTGLWAEGNYQEGILVSYLWGTEEVAGIWALRYENPQAAGYDFESVRASISQPGTCGASVFAVFFTYGMVRCQFSNQDNRIFWNDNWIIHIVTFEGSRFTPDVLADLLRDAIATHWKTFTR